MKLHAKPWSDVNDAAADDVFTSHTSLLPPLPLLQQMQELYIDAMRRTLSRFAPDANRLAGLPIVCVCNLQAVGVGVGRASSICC